MATKKCRDCGEDLDWLGRCQLQRLARPPTPKALIMLMVLVLLAGCVTTQVAKTINIRPQPLQEALIEWSELTGYQVIVPQELTARRSRRVRDANSLTALDKMLRGTGLTYRWINAQTVAIQCPN